MPRTVSNDPITIYALASSQDHVIRYIGQTSDLAARLTAHFREMRLYPNRHISRWKNKVIRDGFEIVCLVLKENAIWSDDEIALIAQYRSQGFALVNGTDGGDGVRGLKLSAEHKAKLIQSAKTRDITPETRARLSQARRDMWASKTPEERAEITEKGAKKQRGIKKSDAFRQMVSAVHSGQKRQNNKPVSDETRQKLSAAAKGRMPSNLAGIHERMVGRPKPQEVREKIARTLAGRTQSEETKRKRGASLRATFSTPEYKAKRSEWMKKAWLTRKRKAHGVDGEGGSRK
jgi:hypothetical protein